MAAINCPCCGAELDVRYDGVKTYLKKHYCKEPPSNVVTVQLSPEMREELPALMRREIQKVLEGYLRKGQVVVHVDGELSKVDAEHIRKEFKKALDGYLGTTSPRCSQCFGLLMHCHGDGYLCDNPQCPARGLSLNAEGYPVTADELATDLP